MASKAIVAPVVQHSGPSLSRFLTVCCCSALINSSILIGAIIIFPMFGIARGSADIQPEIGQATEVAAESVTDLTGLDPGDGSGGPLVYEGTRIEPESVPGPVDPTAAHGIVNAPEAAPTNIPPPPGAGFGTGMATYDPTTSGVGTAAGTLGGMGGAYGVTGFGGRSGSTKEALLRSGGGSKESEQAVGMGLRFLALHQAEEGYWSLNNFHRHARTEPWPAGRRIVGGTRAQPGTSRSDDTAGTAFGLLPFLAAGITHRPSKDQQIDYSKVVGRAIESLITRQVKSGNDAGKFGGTMYSHGLATIAMCEAYGLTSDRKIGTSAQMAINYIIRSQDPAGGGWRYSPRQAGDTSVTGWQLMALKSGQMAGLTVPRTNLQLVGRFLDSCESSSKGGYGYVAGTGETITMTAVGALCRQYLGTSPRNPSLLGSIERIKKTPPGSGNIYYEYYATQVMHHMGGEAWDFWNKGPSGDGKKGIRDTLIAQQEKKPGPHLGSFPGNDHVGGRLGATSMSLLSLEVYYRHLPLYRRDAGMDKDPK